VLATPTGVCTRCQVLSGSKSVTLAAMSSVKVMRVLPSIVMWLLS